MILNFFAIINIKKYNDYALMLEKYCDTSNNQSPLEIETYRHTIYRYLYQIDNNEYDNNKKLFENTYTIILILYAIIVLAFVKKIFILKLDILPIFILIIGFFIYYLYYGNKIKNIYKEIDDLKNNEKSELNKYAKIYKILNAIMYINNFQNNKLKYAGDNLPVKTVKETIYSNIGSIEDTANQSIITNILYNSYKNLDFIKYLTFDKNGSRYYYKDYFNDNRMYININYISDYDDLKNNGEIQYEVIELQDKILEISKKDSVCVNSITSDNDEYNNLENVDMSTEVNENKIFMNIKDNNGNEYKISKKKTIIATFPIYRLLEIEDNFNNADTTTNDNIKEKLKILYNDIVNQINDSISKSYLKDNLPSIIFNDFNYYINNKDVLFDYDNNTFKDIKNIMGKISSNYIYNIIFIILIMYLILHQIYIELNNSAYTILLIFILFCYLIMVLSVIYMHLFNNK
jgi:hypothetical protein